MVKSVDAVSNGRQSLQRARQMQDHLRVFNDVEPQDTSCTQTIQQLADRTAGARQFHVTRKQRLGELNRIGHELRLTPLTIDKPNGGIGRQARL